MDFAVPSDHRVKLKENEKKDKYLDLAKEKLWNMKVTVISIEIGALDTVTKGLIQELEDLDIRGRVKTIQTTALLRSARILRTIMCRILFNNYSHQLKKDLKIILKR